MNNKKLASFTVTSLFTNVSVSGTLEAVTRVVDYLNDNDLPVTKTDYSELIFLCVRFGTFTFYDSQCIQHFGLVMGCPLSVVMACL